MRALLAVGVGLMYPLLAMGFMDARQSARKTGQATRSGMRVAREEQELPDRLPDTDKELISLVETRLHVMIRHGIAVCRLVQVFQNNTERVLEGIYRLPLPEGAEVNGFAVWDEGVKLVGEILPRARARTIYRSERKRLSDQVKQAERREIEQQRLKDPGLLTRSSANACTIRVFPILPRAMKQIEVDYSLVLPLRNGRIDYRFPLALARSFKQVGRTRIEVDLGDALGLRNLRVSPASTVRQRLGSNRTRLLLELTGVPRKDFELSWQPGGAQVGVSLVTHRNPGEDGFFLLRVVPSPGTLRRALARDPRDWLILVDASGSMTADKWKLVSKGVSELFDRGVQPTDRFRLLCFGKSIEDLSGGWRAGAPGPVERALAALAELRPSGSGRLSDAIKHALSLIDSGRPTRILLLTDGVSRTDPHVLARLLARMPKRCRLDTIGTGYDDDTQTLEALAEAGRGEYLVPANPGGMRTVDLGLGRNRGTRRGPYGKFNLPSGELLRLAFLRQGRSPLRGLTLRVSRGAATLDRVYADWGDGLFPGEAALVFGRYRGAGRITTLLEGLLGPEGWSRAITIELPAVEPANRMIGAFWAKRRVTEIEAGQFGEVGTAEIVRLSKTYRFVTSQTAFLALTDQMRQRHALGEAPKDDIEDFYTFSEGTPEPETIALMLICLAVCYALYRRREDELRYQS